MLTLVNYNSSLFSSKHCQPSEVALFEIIIRITNKAFDSTSKTITGAFPMRGRKEFPLGSEARIWLIVAEVRKCFVVLVLGTSTINIIGTFLQHWYFIFSTFNNFSRKVCKAFESCFMFRKHFHE